MPLIKSPSKKARQRNIEEMIESGMEPKRAVAAGYSVQRRAGDHLDRIMKRGRGK
jgi:hypothetical protein